MTASLPIPTRMLVLLGVALLAAAAFLVARPLLLSDDDSTSSPTPPVAATTPTPTTSPTTPATPAKPKVVLLAGLPKPIASKLRQDRVVVVSVYSGTSAGDRTAVALARTGAREAGAAFARMNVLDETRARELQRFVGTVAAPTLLVVRRPGKIVTQLDGTVDAAIVAQAAHNAGARK